MMRFLDFLFPLRSDEAVVREVSTDDFLAKLSPRLVAYTSPPAVALLPFRASAKAAIHEAKYRGSERAFALLAEALREYLLDAELDAARTRIVPVPLASGRRKERGFNQAEVVVRRAAKELDIIVESDLLVRTRETASQVSLPRKAREENMRGAFAAAHPANPSLTYIVFDDVITTGATLQAAVDALKEAGAEHIIPLALAH